MLNERPTPETDAETMSDGVETLTNQSDSTALYQKLCDAVYEIQGLRRERDGAREFLRQTQELCHQYLNAKIKAERERDAAKLRAELDQLKEDTKCPVCTEGEKCWECADDVSTEGAK